MKCEQIQKKLSAFMDNELSETEAGCIREHLKACRMCAEELQAMGSVWDFMETGEAIEPSPYFWTRLSAEIEQREKETVSGPSFWRRLIANPIPAAVIALVLGLLFGNFVGRTLYPHKVYTNGNETEEILALNIFDDLPSGSISEAYYEFLTEEANND